MFNTLNDAKKHGFPIKHVFLPYTKRNPRRRIPTTSGFLSSKIPTTRDSMEVQNTSTSVGEIFCASFTGKKTFKRSLHGIWPFRNVSEKNVSLKKKVTPKNDHTTNYTPKKNSAEPETTPLEERQSSEQSHYFTLCSASMLIFGGVSHGDPS